MPFEMTTPHELLEVLKQVKYPGFSRDIVSFGIVRDIQIGSRGVTVELGTPAADDAVVEQIQRDVHAAQPRPAPVGPP